MQQHLTHPKLVAATIETMNWTYYLMELVDKGVVPLGAPPRSCTIF